MSRLALATLALLLAGPAIAADADAAFADASAGVLLDRVVAVVNDGIVTQSELDEARHGISLHKKINGP